MSHGGPTRARSWKRLAHGKTSTKSAPALCAETTSMRHAPGFPKKGSSASVMRGNLEIPVSNDSYRIKAQPQDCRPFLLADRTVSRVGRSSTVSAIRAHGSDTGKCSARNEPRCLDL
jgi:hypothetical protein